MTRAARAAALALLLAGCDAQTTVQGIDRGEFVAAYIDLRRATVAGELDPETRDSILEAHGTTEEELRDYVERRADDPAAIADTWREIMDSIAAVDTAAAVAADTANDVDADTTTNQPDTLSDS